MRKILVIIAVILMASCESTALYEENRDFPSGMWVADSSQTFTFSILDRNEKYNVVINLRNTLSYPYHNIYLRYELSDENGELVVGDMVEYYLFDPKSGKPYGSGIGDIFDHQLRLLTRYGFEEPGDYSLKLTQYMRPDSLSDILSLGVRVESSPAELEDESQE